MLLDTDLQMDGRTGLPQIEENAGEGHHQGLLHRLVLEPMAPCLRRIATRTYLQDRVRKVGWVVVAILRMGGTGLRGGGDAETITVRPKPILFGF